MIFCIKARGTRGAGAGMQPDERFHSRAGARLDWQSRYELPHSAAVLGRSTCRRFPADIFLRRLRLTPRIRIRQST